MKTKMNIFKQYFYAVSNPKKYNDMIKLGSGRVFLYLLLLSVLTTFITLVGPVVTYFQIGGVTEVVDNYIPKFELNSGLLSTNLKVNDTFDMDDFIYDEFNVSDITSEEGAEKIRPFILYFIAKELSMADYDNYNSMQSQRLASELVRELEDAKFYIYINTSEISVENAIMYGDANLEDLNVDDAIIITRNDFTFLDADGIDDAVNGRHITTYDYDNIFEENINLSKNDILDVIRQVLPFFYIMFFVFVILLFVFSIIGWFIAGLIYSLIALLVNTIIKKNIAYGNLLKIAIYAQTAVIILKTILSYTSVSPFILTYAGYLITIVYIILAIKNIEYIPATPYNGGYNYNNPYNNYYNNGYNQYQNNGYNQPQNNYYNQSQNNGYNQQQNNNYNQSQNNGYNQQQNNNYNQQQNNGYNQPQNNNYNQQQNNGYNEYQNNGYNQPVNNNQQQKTDEENSQTPNNNDDWNNVN